jgi:signal transduction histidine kinase
MTPATLSLESVVRLHSEELSRISHLLRTPLTSIVGFADAIASDPLLESEEKTEFARIIKSEGEKLSRFVEELLHLSFATREPNNVQSCDLATLVSSALHFVSVEAAQRSVTLEYEVLSEERRAVMDRVFVTTMLVNILNNALRYSFEAASILTQAHVAANMLTFHVHSKRSKISVATPDSAQARLHALGLARTNTLLVLNGGSLSFIQNDLGDTTVTMQLPTT